ncbi:MAG TPA: EAL domain-containing protein [Limnochordia bacterium]|nr:EAL domain-containing protein [Limnochordia bacterium]HQD69825.1 EAL domain-containing protein [Limnochordia bacterium]
MTKFNMATLGEPPAAAGEGDAVSLERKIKSVRLRAYVIVVVAAAAVFFATNYLLIQAIRGYFFRMLETQSVNYAQNYSHSLTKAAQAYEVINELMANQILTASKATALYSNDLTNEAAAELAEMLGVDEIYFYSAEGVVEHSNRTHYVGWVARPGHPVHDFMISGLDSLVEDIRPDSESGDLYKYGYFRLDGGRFVQLGISAERVESIQEAFKVQRLLDEFDDLELVDHVCFIDESMTVVASTDPSVIGRVVEDLALRSAIEAGEAYARVGETHHENGRNYEVYVPVYLGEQRFGTLIISQSLDATNRLISQASLLGLFAISVFFLGLIHIVTLNYRHNKDLMHLAYYNSLTKLPNKAYLERVLGDELRDPSSGKKAVLAIHCKNLSVINSTYGFHIGDQVLLELVERLRQFDVSGSDLFQFATHRFILLVKDYQSKEELEDLACRIAAAAEQPLDTVGVSQHMIVMIGILELTDAHCSVDDVFTRLSIAIDYIEQENGRRHAFFDADMKSRLERREVIGRELRSFLKQPDSGVLHLAYQPKINLRTNRIVGFEALARMNSPSCGPISPVEFINIAERQNLIVPLGYWVLETACQFARRLIEEGYPELTVAVNISGIQLAQADFVERVIEIVQNAGIAPDHLELEITESILIEGLDDTQARLAQLRSAGIGIAVDDFGTGYSSFSRLGDLPIDAIKIDKHFIDGILKEEDQKLIIREIITMSHKLGLTVVAEGVEEEKQMQYLRESGCDIMQGFLFSRALPNGEAIKKLKEFIH